MYWVWRGSQCTGFGGASKTGGGGEGGSKTGGGGEVSVLGLEGHQRQGVEGKSVYWVCRGIKDRR